MSDSADSDTPPSRRALAVALKYERGGKDAPRVVATGKGALAERILEIAFASGVRVREDADLAEVLAAVEEGAEIPLAAFAAVAEILTYVYRANGSLKPEAREEG